jgi:hydrogenase expression/formation protein HypE
VVQIQTTDLRLRKVKKIEKILLGHGSGGKLSHSIISEIFLPFFDNPILAKLDDGAVLNLPNKNLVFTTDSYVVDPIFFSGGDIGKIAVCGTVNDLAMMGADPLYLSVAFIIEEGLQIDHLKTILQSMRDAADEAGVKVVTGDTKVVPNGAADKIFINTSGVGCRKKGVYVGGDQAQIGDVIIINGAIAEHGITVLASREGLELDISLNTDSAPLNHLVHDILKEVSHIHVLRDPTRGGIATSLNEIAHQSQVGIKIYEKSLPIPSNVQAVCEILGFDPIYIANEGKCITICPTTKADHVLRIMKKNSYGKDACIIGEVVDRPQGKVFMETVIGGQRIIDMLSGEQLPRIC